MKILFQGDSITNAGRNKDSEKPNVGLGESVKRLSQKYDSLYIPAFENFKKICQFNGWKKYTLDGIHLSADGNTALAELWIKTVFESQILK